MHISEDEVIKLRQRIKKKVLGKVWNLKADCTDENEMFFTLSADDKELPGGDTSPEFLAFLTLVTIGAAVNFMKKDEMSQKNTGIGDAMAAMGNVLIRAWDDLERERAVFLN